MAGLSLLTRDPRLRPIIITSDRSVGGDCQELLLLRRLPAAITSLCECASVRSWDRCLLVRDGEQQLVEEPIALLQPAQLWIELEERTSGAPAVTSSGKVIIEGNRLCWPGKRIEAAVICDVRDLEPPRRTSALIDAGVLGPLRYPVLADLDGARRADAYLQYVPLSTGLTLVKRKEASRNDQSIDTK